jgi:hypothetical protein
MPPHDSRGEETSSSGESQRSCFREYLKIFDLLFRVFPLPENIKTFSLNSFSTGE